MSDGERQQLFLSASSVYTLCHMAPCPPCLQTALWTATFLRGPKKKAPQHPSVATALACSGASNSFKACRWPLTSAKKHQRLMCDRQGRGSGLPWGGYFFFNTRYTQGWTFLEERRRALADELQLGEVDETTSVLTPQRQVVAFVGRSGLINHPRSSSLGGDMSTKA